MAHFVMSDMGYDTPEAAVLAEWAQYASAEVRVVEVRYTDARNAIVITDTVPSHPMSNQTILTNEGWLFTGDASA